MAAPLEADVAIAGGGLSGALIAFRLRQKRPDLRLLVLERGGALGGNHTWSFHQSDVPDGVYRWLSAFVVHRWPRQSVRFPDYERELETPYCSITSARLHEMLAPVLGEALQLDTEIASVDAAEIRLGDGRSVRAGAVIDARGEARSPRLSLGFQKFVGQEIEFAAPHGISAPVIMDATPLQRDGYRFVYILPFSERRALIEDTRYADGAQLDGAAIRADIAAYCQARGWAPARVLREEEGVLPIALAGDIDGYLADAPDGVAVAGMRAALFHPLTGYSLPDAAVLADLIAAQRDLSGPALARLTRAHAAKLWRERGFYRLLCRMLFSAAAPDQRYKVLQRFYRLPRPLIERFYAGRISAADKARVLVGKPPVPIRRAVGCVSEVDFLKNAQELAQKPAQKPAQGQAGQ